MKKIKLLFHSPGSSVESSTDPRGRSKYEHGQAGRQADGQTGRHCGLNEM